MAGQDSGQNDMEVDLVEPARKPWVAPRLTVAPIGVITLAAAATQDDGANNLLAS
ncbi:MAG: hypothetical protein J0H82_06480 [Alphaproteobacteria bacterium]|jgi:hypothetical protein|nr:hypothetical protein [Alphaproteobacteria bacterium]